MQLWNRSFTTEAQSHREILKEVLCDSVTLW
jgi:hypothetical protein